MGVFGIGLPGAEQQRGVAPAGDSETAPRLVEMAVHRVLGDAEAACDLLGMQMRGHQPQAFAFTRREALNRARVVVIPHRRGGNSPICHSSIADRARPPFSRGHRCGDQTRGRVP